MEILQAIHNALSPYLYVEYTVAIIVLTQLFKKAFEELNWHPKWTTFWVTAALGIIGAILKLVVQHETVDPFKLINSFGAACLAYDYVVKEIIDRYRKYKSKSE